MPTWRLPFADITDRGRPYLMRVEPESLPAAFVVRLERQAPGSVPHPGGGFVAAFGNACTHMGCLLVTAGATGTVRFDYRPPQDGLPERLVCNPCPCHGTTFDLTRAGLVVQGPATQNLPQLDLRASGDDAVAEGWLGGAIDPRIEAWPLQPAGDL